MARRHARIATNDNGPEICERWRWWQWQSDRKPCMNLSAFGLNNQTNANDIPKTQTSTSETAHWFLFGSSRLCRCRVDIHIMYVDKFCKNYGSVTTGKMVKNEYCPCPRHNKRCHKCNNMFLFSWFSFLFFLLFFFFAKKPACHLNRTTASPKTAQPK